MAVAALIDGTGVVQRDQDPGHGIDIRQPRGEISTGTDVPAGQSAASSCAITSGPPDDPLSTLKLMANPSPTIATMMTMTTDRSGLRNSSARLPSPMADPHSMSVMST